MKTNINVIYICQLFLFCKCHYIQKCCDWKKQLAINFKTCVDYNGNNEINQYESSAEYEQEPVNLMKLGDNYSHHIWWLPPKIKFVSSQFQQSAYKLKELPMNELTIEFLYDTKPPCSLEDTEVVPFTEYVFLLENGSLLITNIDDNVRPKTMVFPYNSYCLDRVTLVDPNLKRDKSLNLLDHSFAIILCPCLYMPCIRVCCQWKHFLNISKVPNTCQYSPNISLKWNLSYMDENYNEKQNTPGQFGIVKNIPHCLNEVMYLNEDINFNKKFWILSNGNIKAENYRKELTFDNYCIHYWNVNGSYQLNLRICKKPGTGLDFENILYGCYFLVGAFFIAITLIIYGVVEELRASPYAQYLILHLLCLFVTASARASTEFFGEFMNEFICVGIAYTIQFSFIASTLWLNVICVNIFHSFKGFQSKFETSKNIRKKFLSSSFYVWGITFAIFIATMIAEHTEILGKEYKPGFGTLFCWFNGEKAKFIFFYLPITLMFLFNLFLFLFTAQYILKSLNDSNKIFNNENGRYSGTNKSDIKRLKVYLKLFALMGVTWIFEVLSWAIGGPNYYWYLTDALNALRGLFIFIIFCCKKKILYSLLNKFKKQQKITNSGTSSGSESTKNTTSSIQLEYMETTNPIKNHITN